MTTPLVRVCHAVMSGALLLLAVLVPLAYCPWTYEPLELNKQTIAIVLIVIAALAWLGASVAERRIVLKGGGLLLLPVLITVTPLFAHGFAGNAYQSIIGQAGQEYTSVVTYAMFALLVFLAPFAWGGAGHQRTLWGTVLIVAGLIAALSLPRFFGVAIPNIIGSTNALAFYLLVVSILGCGLWLSSRGEGKDDVLPQGVFGVVVKAAIVMTSIVTLLMLLFIDVTGLWVVAIVGMASMFAFALLRAHEFPHFGRFILPMTTLVASIIFVFLPTVLANPFIPEVTLTTHAAVNIAKDTLSSGDLFFGSGAGTYAFDYAKFHSSDVNMSNFWDVRFDRANSHILTFIPTFGLVGSVLYALFLFGLAGAVFTKLAKEKAHAEWKMTFAPFVAWLAMAVGQFFTPFTFTTHFLFWLLSAVLLVHITTKTRTFEFARSPRAGIASSFVFVFALVGLVMLLFVTVSRYSAEIAFARAVALDNTGGNLDDVRVDLDRAATLNRWSDTYYRNLGYTLLLMTSEALKQSPAVDPATVQQLMSASINASVRATQLGVGNVVNWELLGDTYREISPLIADADAFSIEAYTRVIALAPSNPKEYVGLARAYLAQADKLSLVAEGDDALAGAAAKTARDAALMSAEAALKKAKALKSDYTPAQYYLAHVFERQGRLADAVKSMEALRASSPMDVGVAMQLGLLYLQQGKNALAKAELLRAIGIAPNYANAHWYLASIYEQERNLEAAIAEVEKIVVTDPNNALVAQRLQRLKDGLASSQIPEPIAVGETVE